MNSAHVVQQVPALYRSITVFTTVRRLSLYSTTLIQSTIFQPICRIIILIRSSHPRPRLPSGPFPSGFPTKPSPYVPHPSARGPVFTPSAPHSFHPPPFRQANCHTANKIWENKTCYEEHFLLEHDAVQSGTYG